MDRVGCNGAQFPAATTEVSDSGRVGLPADGATLLSAQRASSAQFGSARVSNELVQELIRIA